MTLDPTFTHRIRHTVATLATAGLAMTLGATGCMVNGDGDSDVDSHAKVTCPATVLEWSPDVSYKVGDLREFNGAVFQCLVAHTPAPNWNPVDAASLWSPVTCANGAPVVTSPTDPTTGTGNTGTGNTGTGNTGTGTIDAGGVFATADIKALIDERFFILNVSAASDPARNFTQVTNVGRAGMADIKGLVASGAAKVTATSSGGVEDVTVTVGTERRLQIRRIKSKGFIEGVMVGAATDLKAPFAMTVVNNANGVLTHTVVADVGNNLKNDLRGTASVNDQVVETGAADSALQLNGGLHAFPEGIAIVTDLQFPGIKGF
jgi:hypothetical protein